jgi:hypothetical protein
MPFTPPLTADYDLLIRRLTVFLGAADPNYPEGDTVNPNSPYTKAMLQNQLIQSDYEICALIASVEANPYRNTFFTKDPVVVDSGARIPGYIGVHGGVEVSPAGGRWQRGLLAQSLEHLLRVQDKITIGSNRAPASSLRLYFIDNGALHYCGTTARITLPTIPIASIAGNATPQFGTPRNYQNAVLAHAMTMTRPVGSDAGHRGNWQDIWGSYVQMIADGATSLPEPERLQRNSD